MNIGGVTFHELARPSDRSPVEQGSRDSVDILRTFWQPGRVDEPAKMEARAAFLGYAVLKEETSTETDPADPNFGKKRRWIERSLPHSYTTAPGPWDTGTASHVYASSIESCEPATGHTVADLFPDVGPTAERGFIWKVRYSSWPWVHRADSEVLAPNGVLAADGGLNLGFVDLPARPHEGIALESGWLNSRYVARFARHAGRNVTLPNGFMEFIPQPADPLQPLLPAQPFPYGLPFHHFKMDVEYHWWTPLAAINHELFAKYLNMTCNDATFDFAPAGTLSLKDYGWTECQGYVGNTRMALLVAKFRYEPNWDEATQTFRGVNSSYRSTPDGVLRFWPYRPRRPGGGAIPGEVFVRRDYSELFAPPSTAI